MNSIDTVGIIGLGSMGGAIVRGLLASGLDPESIAGFDIDERRAAELGIRSIDSVAQLALRASAIVLAVKPYLIEGVARGVASSGGGAPVISIAAGVPVARIVGAAPALATRLVRAMPNTAAAVRRSATALFAEQAVEHSARAAAEAVFSAIGQVSWLANEELMHPATAVVGSAPAFVYVLAEALEDAAVLEGMHRSDARKMVRAMLEGAGALLGASERSAAELKDGVTSPGGTTIEGIAALEAGGFRATLIDAVRQTVARSKALV